MALSGLKAVAKSGRACGFIWVGGLPNVTATYVLQVNDFMADAIISQLLLLDAQDPTKVVILSRLSGRSCNLWGQSLVVI